MRKINKRYPKSLKIAAKAEFCAGATLISLSEKYNVPMPTIRIWYVRENWKAGRAELKEQVEKSLLAKMTRNVVKNTEQLIGLSFFGSQIATEELMKVYKIHRENEKKAEEKKKKNKTSKDDQGQDREIKSGLLIAHTQECLRAGKLSAGIMRDTAPVAQEEVMHAALQQLKEILSSDGNEPGGK